MIDKIMICLIIFNIILGAHGATIKHLDISKSAFIGAIIGYSILTLGILLTFTGATWVIVLFFKGDMWISPVFVLTWLITGLYWIDMKGDKK